jgi:c-di-GMP-binding flagellar brake protein YcgR
MSEVLFYPGLPLLLQIPFIEQRINIFVIGWQTELFLLTNMPYLNERPIKLKSDENCIIRFLKGDDAYGFQTSVVSIQFFPAPLIFFKYPVTVNKMPFRKSKRFRLSIPAKILNPQTVQTFDATITDISSTGCQIAVKSGIENKFELGERFFLTLNILEKGIEADCIMRNLRQSEENFLFGMEFASISPASKDLINAFIDMISKVTSTP